MLQYFLVSLFADFSHIKTANERARAGHAAATAFHSRGTPATRPAPMTPSSRATERHGAGKTFPLHSRPLASERPSPPCSL